MDDWSAGPAPSPYSASVLSIYGSLVVIIVLAAFFTGAAVYLFKAQHFPVTPLQGVYATAALCAPFLLDWRRVRDAASVPIVRWAIFYLCITVLWFLWSQHSEVAVRQLRLRALAVAFIALCVLLFSDARLHRIARFGILIASFLAVGLNVYDFFHPQSFSTIFGRAAGLYLNPNISGSALLIAMILGAGLLAPKIRSWYIFIIGLGVLLTVSRGAILCWFLILAVWVIRRQLRLRTLIVGTLASVAVVVGVMMLTGGLARVTEAFAIIQGREDVFARVFNASDVIAGGEASADQRRAVATEALSMFVDSPISGHGIAATTEWSENVSTHNIYLRDLAEYGIFGAVIYPLLLFCLVRGARGEARELAVPAVIFLGTWGMFSHNMLDEWDLLVAMSLIAAIVAHSRRTPPQWARGVEW